MKTARAATLPVVLLLLSAAARGQIETEARHDRAAPKRIAVHEYRAKVYASWLGQMVGNFYGLGYEFKFIDQPGPEAMPYGYTEAILKQLAEADGAFSDDDTDIEYMYLLQMEQHGIEPTYRQLAEAWKTHVRERVWVANRVALNLMHAGFYPPHTGSKEYNSQWFQIDPQLVNEIWAVTSPGMIDYAVGKSEWAARITSDDFGVEPTIHYGAMYAAAFFEDDVERLVEIGLEALPAESRFAQAVRFVRQLVARYPHDWRTARQALAARYHGQFDYNRGAWSAVDANLNGACGIMALLYGQGDFQRTLDLACGLGFDADNQAATMCGLLGAAKGLEAIPRDLLFPVPAANWEKPFNDRYINITRHGLPDAGITDLAERTAAQGERVLLAQGGVRETIDGVESYRIPSPSRFLPPFELNPPPALRGVVGEAKRFELYTGRPRSAVIWELDGTLPPGLTFSQGTIEGVLQEVGTRRFAVHAQSGAERRSADIEVRVYTENLAPAADQILSNPEATDRDVSILRDGDRRKRTYYSKRERPGPQVDYYGYAWGQPQRISVLRFSVGRREESGGWFTSLAVEYRTESGDWAKVSNLRIVPEPNWDNRPWLKASDIDYELSFDPVATTAIRLVGDAGGTEPDPADPTSGTRRYTAISELSVHER